MHQLTELPRRRRFARTIAIVRPSTSAVRRHLAVAVPTLAMLALVPNLALAGNPTAGTGIAADDGRQRSPDDLGYTTSYAEAKEAEAAGGSVIGPSVVDPGGGGSYPSSDALTFTIYHQKTAYYCVPAVGQSIAHYAFGGYTTPTVADNQQDIAEAMGTTTAGTIDSNGLAWLNARFSEHDRTWRYTQYDSGTLTTFTNHVKYDVAGYNMPMYVRVQLASGHYAWTQHTNALHATLATGYSNSGSNVRSADPFAHTKADGTCTSSWDNGAANTGCIWGAGNGPYRMSEYFAAESGANPEWF